MLTSFRETDAAEAAEEEMKKQLFKSRHKGTDLVTRKQSSITGFAVSSKKKEQRYRYYSERSISRPSNF
jgi:type I site-specific restriction endonuclease